MKKILIILTTLVISISCTKKQTSENDVIIAYTIEDDSLRHAINKFIPQIKDSALIPVLEITPKDIYVYYKIYAENNAFALMKIPDLFFAKADGRIIAVTYGEKPENYYDNPDFSIKEEYGWSVLKDIFPEQYTLYKQGKTIETPQYIRPVLSLDYRYGICRGSKYIKEVR